MVAPPGARGVGGWGQGPMRACGAGARAPRAPRRVRGCVGWKAGRLRKGEPVLLASVAPPRAHCSTVDKSPPLTSCITTHRRQWSTKAS